MKKGIDLNHIYQLRRDFTIIALTGGTASGCSDVADQLVRGFGDGKDFTNPKQVFKDNGNKFPHNSYRKLRIVYDFASENFEPFIKIKYKDVLTLFILQHSVEELKKFLTSSQLKKEFEASNLLDYDFLREVDNLNAIRSQFEEFSLKMRDIDFDDINENHSKLYSLFFQSEFLTFSEELHNLLSKDADIRQHKFSNASLSYHKAVQVISNNLRRCGKPYEFDEVDSGKIFTIAEAINELTKCIKENSQNGRTQVVINSLKNPLEIMFFKQRYAAFYAIAVNQDEESLKSKIWPKFTMTNDKSIVQKILKEEHDGGKDSEFFKQNIGECLQLADIHISFITHEQAKQKNDELERQKKLGVDNTSPYFSWNDQILKFVSLIENPGVITPSPEERCMQLAYTAKHNSGCISRHVGAAITDESYSVKAIGWNTTPEGQVPCVLRKTEDLLTITSESDLQAFTPFEKYNEEFQSVLRENFEQAITDNKENLKGRNACFCFKSLRNSYSEGKNQVHTRSLHAEESAFLQISKYGGVGIRNGKLFSTASPCELCAKKACQLGIKVIYYIDPYPGLSMDHILKAGNDPIDVRLFSGAIGNAYHRLYDPIMPYKDEVALRVGHEIKDVMSKYKKKHDDLKIEYDKLAEKIKALESKK